MKNICSSFVPFFFFFRGTVARAVSPVMLRTSSSKRCSKELETGIGKCRRLTLDERTVAISTIMNFVGNPMLPSLNARVFCAGSV